jgi:hypothetical protein
MSAAMNNLTLSTSETLICNYGRLDNEDTSTKNSPLINSLGGGKFSLDGQIHTLANAIKLLQLEYADGLEKQLGDKLEDMAIVNDTLERARGVLQLLRVASNSLDDDKDKINVPQEAINYFDEFNIPGIESKNNLIGILPLFFNNSSTRMNKDGLRTSIENIGSHIENTNQQSQLKMLSISSLLKGRDNAIELVNQTIKEAHSILQSLIRNLN